MLKPSEHFFTAFPASRKAPGVIVLHAWWGLNAFIQDFCQRLAAEGFSALAPDLYHGKTAATIPEAELLRSKVSQKQVSADILAALDQLLLHPGVAAHPIGVVGFSFGAHWGLWLACEKPEWIGAVAVFYGTRAGDYTRSQASFLGHFADKDKYVSQSGIKKLEKSLRQAGRPVLFNIYPGTGHWFFESDRPDAYDPLSAILAWQGTLDFLHDTLDG